MTPPSTWFERVVLPAFAFKAVVIGGGYATGRELAEYFLPSGPRGGLFGMSLAAIIWSVVCALTFMLAQTTRSLDYRSFFHVMLGRFGFVFEAAYFAFVLVALSVFGAASGAIAAATLGVAPLIGTLALVACIATVTTFGSTSVESLFKYVSILLYATYALFMVLCALRFGGRMPGAFAAPAGDGWAAGGLAYAGYNIVAAVVILPVTRHFATRRQAAIAGALCGPLAMLPALLFFVCMAAWYPAIQSAALPSDYLLQRLDLPAFRLLFQLMVFAALLESGAGMVHAVNERVAVSYRAQRGVALPRRLRLAASLTLLFAATEIAGRFGLVALIASGYRALAWAFLCTYCLPLFTVGVWRLCRGTGHTLQAAA
jgi:uncharacterized membrane protein YkvI